MKKSSEIRIKAIYEEFSSIKGSFKILQSDFEWLLNSFNNLIDRLGPLLEIMELILTEISMNNASFIERLSQVSSEVSLLTLERRIEKLHKSNYELYRVNLLEPGRRTLKEYGIGNHRLIVDYIRRVGLIKMKRSSTDKTYNMVFVGQTKYQVRRLVPHGQGCFFRGNFSVKRNPQKDENIASVTKNKIVFKGSWILGKREGKGVEYDPKTGFVEFEGLYSQNRKHGRGTQRIDGKVIEGVWKLGILAKKRKEYQFEYIKCTDEIRKQLVYENEIGKGATSSVFKISYRSQTYALKLINFEFHTYNMQQQIIKQKIIKSLHNNVQLMKHENICKIYGLVEDGKRMGMLLEYCSQSSVDKFIMRCAASKEFRKKISLRVLIRFLLQTAKGMQYLHSASIIHRDLKWGNCLINSDAKIRICDFDSSKEDVNLWKNSLNYTRSCVGTPYFSAPELFSGHYSLKIDVFSFGVMMYCIIFSTNNPYQNRKICNCGIDLESFTIHTFPYHLQKCQLRPKIPDECFRARNRQRLFMVNEKVNNNNNEKSEEEDQEKKVYDSRISFLVNFMKQLWQPDPNSRPSFKTIVRILESDWKMMGLNSELFCSIIIDVFVSRPRVLSSPSTTSSFGIVQEETLEKDGKCLLRNREILVLEMTMERLKESIRLSIREEKHFSKNNDWKIVLIESANFTSTTAFGEEEEEKVRISEKIFDDNDLKRIISKFGSNGRIPEMRVWVLFNNCNNIVFDDSEKCEERRRKEQQELEEENEGEDDEKCSRVVMEKKEEHEEEEEEAVERLKLRIKELEEMNRGSEIMIEKQRERITELLELVESKDRDIQQLSLLREER